jgi:hypothetical protein
MVFVLLVVQSSLKILNEAPIINFIRRDRPRINHSCLMKKKRKYLARNLLSDTEDESDDRAASSKIKVTKKFLKISFQLHYLFENYLFYLFYKFLSDKTI